jgi:arginyl-tRNA synthetase
VFRLSLDCPTAAPTLESNNFRAVLSDEVSSALSRAFGEEAAGADPMVTPATRADFGDYQCNAALALAKRLKAKPRDVAVRARASVMMDGVAWDPERPCLHHYNTQEKIMGELRISEWCEAPEIAGPGFINVRLKPGFVEERLNAMLRDPERLAIPR